MDETPTPVEDRLRAAMDRALDAVDAADGPPVADPADLSRRRIRHHRRQRAGRVAAAAAVVVAGVVGGWAVGLGTDSPADVEDVAADRRETIPTPPTVDPTRVIVDPDGVPIVVPQPPDPGVDSGAAARQASGSYTSIPPNLPWYEGIALPTALTSSRTLDDGTRVQVRTNRYDPAIYELPPFWAPPAWCFPVGDVEIRTSGAGWSTTTLAVRYAAAEDGTVAVRSRLVGSEGGDPHWVTVVHGPAGTASVRADYAGGTADEAEPIDGLAVLSAPVGSVDLDDDLPVTVVARAADGTELARSVAPWAADELGEPAADPPSERPACAVPIALPPPGEQPADPAAAEAAVLAVWDATFGRPAEVTVEEQLAATVDTRGVRPALQKVREGVSTEVLSETTIAIDDLVFTRPDQVFVHYTVVIATGTYADLYGELLLVDGTWKVSRQTVCDLAETGGGICQPLTDG